MVNLGNSGGVLINVEGEFVGINIVILIEFGVFEGYFFVIFFNFVCKVIIDFRVYG